MLFYWLSLSDTFQIGQMSGHSKKIKFHEVSHFEQSELQEAEMKSKIVTESWGDKSKSCPTLISFQQFEKMTKQEQDFYLMCQIVGQEYTVNKKQNFITYWYPSRDKLKDLYRVGNDRLVLCAKTI